MNWVLPDLTKGQKIFLRRHICAWCEVRIAYDHCLAYDSPCSREMRADRATRCLQGYKPRRFNSTSEHTVSDAKSLK